MIYKKLAGDTRSQYQAAVDNKDMLLDYQANSAKRTQLSSTRVTASTWTTMSGSPWRKGRPWKKKKELQQEKHMSRLDRKITFDFAGRKVVALTGLL